MNSLRSRVAVVLILIATASRFGFAADAEGFVPLFNGKDLGGWVPVNVAPGTFTVKDGLIVSTGKPTGVMRTDRMYENFILEIEWRHMVKGGNAGLFIWSDAITAPGVPFSRAIEVQILDGRESETYTSDGDVFSIHGARLKPDRPHPKGAERCLPSEKRSKPSPEWNHYRVECRDGDLKLAVNGKVVSGGSMCRPRKGYICLESEGSECHFRNIKIKELPSSNPPADEVATSDQGFRSIYTGLDLSGWLADSIAIEHWYSEDWRLTCDGKGKKEAIMTALPYGDFELICDCRWSSKSEKQKLPIWLSSADLDITVEKVAPQWNRFHIRRQGNRMNVKLNGQVVVDNHQLVGVPAWVGIGLRHDGEPIQFANIYIRELDAKP
jgi:hypothetical protein